MSAQAISIANDYRSENFFQVDRLIILKFNSAGVRTFHEVNTNNILSLVLDSATIRVTPEASRVRIYRDHAAINKVTDVRKNKRKDKKEKEKRNEGGRDFTRQAGSRQRRFLTVVQLRNDG